MERGFKGVWIPKEVWLNKELNNSEKLFLVEIDSFDSGQGCRLSIDHFKVTFGYGSRFIIDTLNGLERKGYIHIHTDNDADRGAIPLLIIDNQKYGKRV